MTRSSFAWSRMIPWSLSLRSEQGGNVRKCAYYSALSKVRVHAFVYLGGISALEKPLDRLAQVGQCLVLGIPLADYFQFDALGNVSAVLGPYSRCQSHAASLLHPGRSCIRDHHVERRVMSARCPDRRLRDR